MGGQNTIEPELVAPMGGSADQSDGGAAISDQQDEHLATLTMAQSTFTCPGYHFSHWNTAADDSGTSYARGGRRRPARHRRACLEEDAQRREALICPEETPAYKGTKLSLKVIKPYKNSLFIPWRIWA